MRYVHNKVATTSSSHPISFTFLVCYTRSHYGVALHDCPLCVVTRYISLHDTTSYSTPYTTPCTTPYIIHYTTPHSPHHTTINYTTLHLTLHLTPLLTLYTTLHLTHHLTPHYTTTPYHTQILQDFPFAKSKHEALLHKIELLQSRITQAHRYWDRVSAEVDRCEVRDRDIEVNDMLMQRASKLLCIMYACDISKSSLLCVCVCVCV